MVQKIESGELLESFGTGTAAVISPIGELSYNNKVHTLNENQVGPLSHRLAFEIQGIQQGTQPDVFNWVQRVT